MPDEQSSPAPGRPPSGLADDIRGYWDLRSNGFSESVMHELSNGGSEACNELIGMVGPVPGDSVLDVGCGPGYFELYLGTRGVRVTGIDTSEEMIRRGRANAAGAGADAEFHVMDAADLGFPDSSFDHVVSRNVLWNLVDPVTAYREMLRVLRPGGSIGVLDGNFYLEGRNPIKAPADRDWSCHERFNTDGVDMSVIGEIARDLPLSRLERPGWDVGVLSRMPGCGDITVRPLGPRDGSSAPGAFMIVARKVVG